MLSRAWETAIHEALTSLSHEAAVQYFLVAEGQLQPLINNFPYASISFPPPAVIAGARQRQQQNPRGNEGGSTANANATAMTNSFAALALDDDEDNEDHQDQAPARTRTRGRRNRQNREEDNLVHAMTGLVIASPVEGGGGGRGRGSNSGRGSEQRGNGGRGGGRGAQAFSGLLIARPAQQEQEGEGRGQDHQSTRGGGGGSGGRGRRGRGRGGGGRGGGGGEGAVNARIGLVLAERLRRTVGAISAGAGGGGGATEKTNTVIYVEVITALGELQSLVAESQGRERQWSQGATTFQESCSWLFRGMSLSDAMLALLLQHEELLEMTNGREELANMSNGISIAAESGIHQRDTFLHKAQRRLHVLDQLLAPQLADRDAVRATMGDDAWTNNPRPKNDYANRRVHAEAEVRELQHAIDALAAGEYEAIKQLTVDFNARLCAV
jgi:hypothetical protein